MNRQPCDTTWGLEIARFMLLAGLLACSGCTPTATATAIQSPPTQKQPQPLGSADSDATMASDQPRDWPQLFGPRGNSHSRETGLQWNWSDAGPPLVWRRPTGAGYSSPVLRSGRLIVQFRRADEELIECLDAATGDVAWTFNSPTTYVCKYPYSEGPYSTPAIGEGVVYTLSAQGVMHALSLDAGTLLWCRNLLADFGASEGAFGVGNSPLLTNGRLVINIGGKPNAGVVCLEAATGATLWTATNHGRGYTTAHAAHQHGQDVLYVMTEEGLDSLDAETGHVRWTYPFGVQATPERVNAVSPQTIGDLVVLTSGPGPGTIVLKIEPDGSHTEVWKNRRVLDSQYTNVVHVDGVLLGVTSRKAAVLRCVDLMTGGMLWEHESELCRANSLFVDGHLLCLGEHGHLANFRFDRTQPVLVSMTAEPLLKTPCFSAPALADGRLYLRNEIEVLCFDLRPPEKGESVAESP